MAIPATLRMDAWNAGSSSGATTDGTGKWVLRDRLRRGGGHLLPRAADENDWRHPSIGWGLVLPEPSGDHGISAADLATANDQPASIRRLVDARTINGVEPPILRFKPDRAHRFSTLLNYRTQKPVAIDGAPQGISPGALPFYLLIYASPSEVPWELQYLLNSTCRVGRLDLTEAEGLGHYVDALLSDDWSGGELDVLRTAIWAVHHDEDDISALLLKAIGARISKSYAGDGDLKDRHRFVDGRSGPATHARLLEAIRPGTPNRPPGVVITTSHGLTDVTLGPAQQRQRIGLPVDQEGQALDLEALFADDWSPNGGIWYCHGCCTAGGDDMSVYRGLVSPDSSINAVLTAVTDFSAKGGSCVAPLPRRLLGAARPARAFIGHVEPTFDWTLRNEDTGQYLTDRLRFAMYDQLFGGRTVGLALRDWYSRIGPLGQQFGLARQAYSKGEDVGDRLLYYQLAQRDVQSIVILGDPTVRLPVG